MIKILYLIEPDGLVNQRYKNFLKMVWTTMVHLLRFRIKQPVEKSTYCTF